MEHKEWKGKTDGLPWMQQTLIRMMRVTGVRFFYFIMALVLPWYLVLRHKSYLAIYHFFRRRFGQSPLRAFLSVCRSEFTVGQIVMDRFAAHAGHHFDIELEGDDLWWQLNDSDEGFVQLSSHVGSLELTGYCLKVRHKRIYALVFEGESSTVMKYRQTLFEANNIEMVVPKEDMSHIFILSAALRDGMIVSIPGDRVYGSLKTVTCDFMGGKADFPLGPFLLAVQRQMPVLTIYTLRVSAYRYRTFVERLDYTPGLNSREQMTRMAQKYASSLELIVKRYPYQWLNYYEFWKE